MPTSDKLDLLTLDSVGFDRLWVDRIGPLLSGHEQARLRAMSHFRKGMWLTVPAAVGAGALAAAIVPDSDAIGFAAIATGVVGYALSSQPLSRAGKIARESLVGAIAEEIGVRFQAEGFAPPAFERSLALGLLPAHDRSATSDLFHGQRHGCAFDLYEAHLERERRDSDGDPNHTTVFRGQIIRIAFPKPFLGVTVVRRDAGVFTKSPLSVQIGAMIRIGFGLREGPPGLERVGLADPKFERLFEVYSNDQVEARYLVHPVFVERLMEIEAAFGGQRVRCAFERGDLIVAIEGGDRFQMGDLFKTFADPKRAQVIVEDLRAILRLMEAVLTAERAPLLRQRRGPETD